MVPPTRDRLNPRAASRLGLAARRRITVVHAPAGCGKSTAIAHHVRGSDTPHATATVLGHNAATSMARTIAAGLAAVDPELLRLLPAVWINARRHTQPSRSVARWMGRRLRGPLTIVVDELHRLDPDGPAFDFLVDLIDASSDGVRWILGMRDLAGIPLPRWLASGMADGSVNGDAFGERIDDATPTIEALLDRADALLALCFLAMPSDARHEGAPESLRRLAGDLRDARPDIFGDEQTFVLPEHWRSEIIATIAARAPSSLLVGRIVAARFAEATGRLADALALYQEAGSIDDVQRLLDVAGFALLNTGFGDIVVSAIDTLPLSRRDSTAISLYFQAQDDAFRGRYDLSESWYEHALQLARDDTSRRQIEVSYAIALGRRGREEGVARLEALAQSTANDPWAVVALSSLAAAHAAAGRIAEATSELARALHALPAVDPSDAAIVHQRAAFVRLRAGEIADAAAHAERAAGIAQSTANEDVLAVARSVSYVIASSYDDDPANALSALRAIGQAGSRLRNDFFKRFALIGTFLIAAEAADDGMLQELERELSTAELEASIDQVNQGLLPAKALLCAWSGHYDLASQAIRAGDDQFPTAIQRILRGAEIALYAGLAGASDDARSALTLAGRGLRDEVEPTESVDFVRAALTLALAAHVAGDGELARETLNGLEPALDRWPRWRPFASAVAAIATARDIEPERLLNDLEQMHAARLGGYARLIEHAPAAVFGLAGAR